MPAFFGIICPRRVVPSRANAAVRHKMSGTDIPQACPRGMSGNATHQEVWTYSPTRGRAVRGRAKRAHKRGGKAGLCAQARPQGARSAHKCGGKAREEGRPRRWKRGWKPRAAATRPNRKRRYRKRGGRRALARSSYRGAAGGRESAGDWRHGGEMPPSREGKGCRRSQGRSAPSQQPIHITRATRRGGSHTAAASVTRATPRALRLQPEDRGSGRPQAQKTRHESRHEETRAGAQSDRPSYISPS